MSDTTSSDDGLFEVPTKIIDHLAAASDLDTLMADDAWLYEDDLTALLAVCRDVLEHQRIADELAYILLHLGDDVIDGRRVYIVRGRGPFPLELVAMSLTVDDVLRITPLPLQGVRVAEQAVGSVHTPARTYVDGKPTS